jgi:hypothetical protein
MYLFFIDLNFGPVVWTAQAKAWTPLKKLASKHYRTKSRNFGFDRGPDVNLNRAKRFYGPQMNPSNNH